MAMRLTGLSPTLRPGLALNFFLLYLSDSILHLLAQDVALASKAVLVNSGPLPKTIINSLNLKPVFGLHQ
jgi:hypothetical protein